MNDNELLSVTQAAEYLGMARQSLYRLLKAEALPYVDLGGRTWRVRRKDLEEFVQERMRGGANRSRRTAKGQEED